MAGSPSNDSRLALEEIAFARANSTASPKFSSEAEMPEDLSSALEEFRSKSRKGKKNKELKPLSDQDEQFVSELVDIIRSNWASSYKVKENVENLISQKKYLVGKLDKFLESENRHATKEELEFRNALLDECERLKKEFLEKCAQDRDFYYAIHGEALKSYSHQMHTGRIAEVPYVSEKLEEIDSALKNREIVLLHGHTGTGKTEIARIAAKRFAGKDPVVVRGYPQMSQEELYGHLALSANKNVSWLDIIQQIDEACSEFDKENPDLSEEDRARKHNQIVEIACNENSVTVSEYVLGAHYIAMKEGRVIIVDEANAIRPELRRKANDLDTKRIGETVTIQEDGGMNFKVAEGYGKIETANLGSLYGEGSNGRHAYTPDEGDRRTQIEIDYLPQSIKAGFDQISDPKQKQLFTIAVAALLDKSGDITAPGHALQTLWNLSQFAAMTQIVFSGKIDVDNPDHSSGMFSQGGSANKAPLDQSITPRKLQRIINRWRNEGFRFEIDHYIKKLVLDQTTDPTQRAFLHQMGSNFKFFASDGWPKNPNYGQGKLGHFQIDSPENREKDITTIKSRKIIEALFGAAPERSVWPKPQASPDSLLPESDRLKVAAGMTKLGDALQELELNQ